MSASAKSPAGDERPAATGTAAAAASAETLAATHSWNEKVILLHMFANVTGICMLLQARPALILRALKGDATALAKRLTMASSAVGVLELLLNPIAGQLSDRYGRRPFLLLSPVFNMVNKMLVSLNPGSLTA